MGGSWANRAAASRPHPPCWSGCSIRAPGGHRLRTAATIAGIPADRFARDSPARGADTRMVFQDATGQPQPAPTMPSMRSPEPYKRRLGGMSGKRLGMRVDELAHLTGPAGDICSRATHPHQLSGGQKARVGGIWRAPSPPSFRSRFPDPGTSPPPPSDVSIQAVVASNPAGPDLRARLNMTYLFVSPHRSERGAPALRPRPWSCATAQSSRPGRRQG